MKTGSALKCILMMFLLVRVVIAGQHKPRVVITADPELDDNNTIIRAILYSSDLQIEGLVYASSTFHWKGDGQGTTQYLPGREYTKLGLCPCTSWRWAADEHFIDDIVDAYAKVYADLKIHNPNYPAPSELRSKIKWGNVAFEGDYSKDTEGSNLIKALLLDDKTGPLYVTAQGGQSTIARALKSIYDEYANTAQWETIRDRVSLKLIIIPFGDQDGTYASYIRPNWPEVTERQLSTMDFGYFVRTGLTPENQVYVSTSWTRENISSRGPLGAMYRVWGDGKQMVKGDRTDYFGMAGASADELKKMGYMVWMPPQEKGSFLSEGDTPTFLNLLDNGLRAYEDGHWSGWGGVNRVSKVAATGMEGVRVFGPDDAGIAMGLVPAGSRGNESPKEVKAAAGVTAGAAGDSNVAPISAANVAANIRFFAAAQNDFATRLKWSVTPKFSDANHEPRISIKGKGELLVRPGITVRLEGEVSDPDHNAVQVTWWQDSVAGTYPSEIRLSDQAGLSTKFRVPSDAQPGSTINVILEATDDGKPPLTRYQRFVVRVR